MTHELAIIVAVAQNGIIGGNNQLLWHLPADMKHFKTLTTGHTIVMGRKTYESIGRPLPNRVNVIISRNPDFKADGCTVVATLAEAINPSSLITHYSLSTTSNTIFIIGGAEIYHQALPFTDKIYLTEVKASFEGDTYFPTLNPEEWQEIARNPHTADEKNLYDYDFVELVRVRR